MRKLPPGVVEENQQIPTSDGGGEWAPERATTRTPKSPQRWSDLNVPKIFKPDTDVWSTGFQQLLAKSECFYLNYAAILICDQLMGTSWMQHKFILTAFPFHPVPVPNDLMHNMWSNAGRLEVNEPCRGGLPTGPLSISYLLHILFRSRFWKNI